MARTATTHWLPLPTALNLRDVGGLPTAAGGHVRTGVLLRGGSLRLLSIEDARALVTDYGVHTVVDLRTPRCSITSTATTAAPRPGCEHAAWSSSSSTCCGND